MSEYTQNKTYLSLNNANPFNYSLYNRNKKMTKLINESDESALPLSDYQLITYPSIIPVGGYGVSIHAIGQSTMF